MQMKGQGAIEYLLLLAAAVVVVAVVISFMIGTIGPVQDTGSRETYNYICLDKPSGLDSNSLVCGCYECDKSKGDRGKMANATNCTALSVEKNDSLLDAVTNCGWTTP